MTVLQGVRYIAQNNKTFEITIKQLFYTLSFLKT